MSGVVKSPFLPSSSMKKIGESVWKEPLFSVVGLPPRYSFEGLGVSFFLVKKFSPSASRMPLTCLPDTAVAWIA